MTSSKTAGNDYPGWAERVSGLTEDRENSLVGASWNILGEETTIRGQLPFVLLTVIREEGRLSATPDETIERLGLSAEEEGKLLPGYMVKIDEITGILILSYTGPGDDRFDDFVDNLVEFGHELSAREIVAQTNRAIQLEAARETRNAIVARKLGLWEELTAGTQQR